jgi:hypothetical protein
MTSLRALVLGLALVLAPACGAAGMSPEQVAVQTAIVTANTTRLSVETAEATALTLYRAEQVAAVERVKALPGGGSAEQAVAEVKLVRTKWEPVWTVLDKAHAAHALLVQAIQAYETTRTPGDIATRAAALVALVSEVADAVRAVRGER